MAAVPGMLPSTGILPSKEQNYGWLYAWGGAGAPAPSTIPTGGGMVVEGTAAA